MEEGFDKHVKEIMSGTMCYKGFACYKQGFENLCRAQDVGLEGFLECLEEPSPACSFSTRYANAFYCSCPVRVYVGKNLENKPSRFGSSLNCLSPVE
jgi:hypothetical protein